MPRPAAIAGDAKIDRTFANAFEPELPIKRLPVGCNVPGLLQTSGEKQVADLFTALPVANDNEVPRLHVTDRGGVVAARSSRANTASSTG